MARLDRVLLGIASAKTWQIALFCTLDLIWCRRIFAATVLPSPTNLVQLAVGAYELLHEAPLKAVAEWILPPMGPGGARKDQ